MSYLIRTRQGQFTIDEAYTLDEIESGNFKIYTMSEALRGKPYINIDEKLLKQVKNGVVIDIIDGVLGETVFYQNDEAIAIYDLHTTTMEILKPVRVL